MTKRYFPTLKLINFLTEGFSPSLKPLCVTGVTIQPRLYNETAIQSSFIMNSDIQNKNCTFITLLDLRELHCTLPFILDFTCLPIHSPHCCNTYLTHCERCFTYSLCLYVLKWYWSFHSTMYFYIFCCVQTILLFARPYNFPSQNNPKLFAGI